MNAFQIVKMFDNSRLTCFLFHFSTDKLEFNVTTQHILEQWNGSKGYNERRFIFHPHFFTFCCPIFAIIRTWFIIKCNSSYTIFISYFALKYFFLFFSMEVLFVTISFDIQVIYWCLWDLLFFNFRFFFSNLKAFFWYHISSLTWNSILDLKYVS